MQISGAIEQTSSFLICSYLAEETHTTSATLTLSTVWIGHSGYDIPCLKFALIKS